MKTDRFPPTGTPATLQDVLQRLADAETLSEIRRRDLRSAVMGFAKLTGMPPIAIPLDLGAIRQKLDGMVPAQAKMSAKRFANLRSDLAAAFAAASLIPMLKTARVALDPPWEALLEPVTDRQIRNGLSRFARWASLRRIAPRAVDMGTIERFIAELEASSLVRNIRERHRGVAAAWNALVALRPGDSLQSVDLPAAILVPMRVSWERLPRSLRDDVERYLVWCSVPDPLDEQARKRALAPLTVRLRRNHIHSAVDAAHDAGINLTRLTSLAILVEPETVRSLLRQCWNEGDHKLTAYTHGLAGTLIAIASEWVKAEPATIAALKKLRSKLGALPSGLTEKNKALLRKFDDSRLLEGLIQLPDRLWGKARRDLAHSRRPFIDLQTALAVDILIHVPLRMENLAALKFEEHLHWPQGRGKPALIVLRGDETKNSYPLEYELPAALADRLLLYRNEIAPRVTGKRPEALFVAWTGKPRTLSAVTVAIEKGVLRNLGLEITPHQFRHLAAKIILDANPGAYELVRQMLGHKNMKTTTNFYAGIDTKRAGRAHADLLLKLREGNLRRGRGRRPSKDQEK